MFLCKLADLLGVKSIHNTWRREEDSNLRYPFGYSAFRVHPVHPLRHLASPLCGPYRARTGDLLDAIETRYQLRQRPMLFYVLPVGIEPTSEA